MNRTYSSSLTADDPVRQKIADRLSPMHKLCPECRQKRVEAIPKIQDTRLPQSLRIARYVASCGRGGATRMEISEAIQIQYSSVCGAVKSLVDQGTLVSTDRKRLTPTGRPATVLRHSEWDR